VIDWIADDVVRMVTLSLLFNSAEFYVGFTFKEDEMGLAVNQLRELCQAVPIGMDTSMSGENAEDPYLFANFLRESLCLRADGDLPDDCFGPMNAYPFSDIIDYLWHNVFEAIANC